MDRESDDDVTRHGAHSVCAECRNSTRKNDVTGDVVQVSNRNDTNWIAPWD
jgi:hypothetical protein